MILPFFEVTGDVLIFRRQIFSAFNLLILSAVLYPCLFSAFLKSHLKNSPQLLSLLYWLLGDDTVEWRAILGPLFYQVTQKTHAHPFYWLPNGGLGPTLLSWVLTLTLQLLAWCPFWNVLHFYLLSVSPIKLIFHSVLCYSSVCFHFPHSLKWEPVVFDDSFPLVPYSVYHNWVFHNMAPSNVPMEYSAFTLLDSSEPLQNGLQ